MLSRLACPSQSAGGARGHGRRSTAACVCVCVRVCVCACVCVRCRQVPFPLAPLVLPVEGRFRSPYEARAGRKHGQDESTGRTKAYICFRTFVPVLPAVRKLGPCQNALRRRAEPFVWRAEQRSRDGRPIEGGLLPVFWHGQEPKSPPSIGRPSRHEHTRLLYLFIETFDTDLSPSRRDPPGSCRAGPRPAGCLARLFAAAYSGLSAELTSNKLKRGSAP